MAHMGNGDLSPNCSEVGLMTKAAEDEVGFRDGGASTSGSSSDTDAPRRKMCCGALTGREFVSVFILCFVNLINYMDRYTVAGILVDIQCYYQIGDSLGGLLQTGFVVSYMLFAPLFGYLGDRYSRKIIMAVGVFLWSLTTLLGSFMESYVTFFILRMCVGVGEASYSTIAPTIISDLFVKDLRTKILALFYFAIPVGSGLGYVIGSETAKAAGSWHWGLRVTPVMGLIAVVLILIFLQDPPRGESEGGAHLKATSWTSDLKALCKNKTFMLSTVGFTTVAFVAGALSWFGPKFIALGLAAQGNEDVSLSDVSYKFGIITMVSGLVGVPLGGYLGQKLRVRWGNADPLVCAGGLLISAPLIFAAAFLADSHTIPCYILVFFGEVALNLNWAVVADILLYVVIPTRRSTAEAFQILFSHAFGDAGSPYLIGAVSEALQKSLNSTYTNFTDSVISPVGNFTPMDLTFATPAPANCSGGGLNTDYPVRDFHALKYALFICVAVEVLGGVFFLFTAIFIKADKSKAERITAGAEGLGHLGDVGNHIADHRNIRPHHIYAHEPESRTLIS